MGARCGTPRSTCRSCFNEARPGGRDGRRRAHHPPARRPASTRPGPEAGMGGDKQPEVQTVVEASTRPGPEAGMGDGVGGQGRGDRGASTRPGPEAGMGVERVHGVGLSARASTRPGPEAGMGAAGLVPATAAGSSLQRGPARRPGWATEGLALHITHPVELQRGPARRPGWAVAFFTKSLQQAALQRGPARRPGWASRGRVGPEPPDAASTRPGPEAGMGDHADRRLRSAHCRLQRGPARRPGWAWTACPAEGGTAGGFNEARPGGRDGRRSAGPGTWG